MAYCERCGNQFHVTQLTRRFCSEKCQNYRWAETHRDVGLRAERGYRARNRLKVNASNTVRRAKYAAKYRAEMIEAYGGACSCCGETEPRFLVIDHIKGGGTKERRETKRTGWYFYKYLKLLGWPKDRYRLLCANCNHGRQMNGGTCPQHRHVS